MQTLICSVWYKVWRNINILKHFEVKVPYKLFASMKYNEGANAEMSLLHVKMFLKSIVMRKLDKGESDKNAEFNSHMKRCQEQVLHYSNMIQWF